MRLRIKELREKAKLSQKELAEIAGLEQASITNIEKGRRDISLVAAWRIAKHFGISIAELFEE